MYNDYLIPANANRGKLIFGYFRPIDLGIFCVGIGFSILLMLMFQNAIDDIWIALACASPGLICTFLVIPIPNYHNILIALQEAYRFISTNQSYEWKGWCFRSGKEK